MVVKLITSRLRDVIRISSHGEKLFPSDVHLTGQNCAQDTNLSSCPYWTSNGLHYVSYIGSPKKNLMHYGLRTEGGDE